MFGNLNHYSRIHIWTSGVGGLWHLKFLVFCILTFADFDILMSGILYFWYYMFVCCLCVLMLVFWVLVFWISGILDVWYFWCLVCVMFGILDFWYPGFLCLLIPGFLCCGLLDTGVTCNMVAYGI